MVDDLIDVMEVAVEEACPYDVEDEQMESHSELFFDDEYHDGLCYCIDVLLGYPLLFQLCQNELEFVDELIAFLEYQG